MKRLAKWFRNALTPAGALSSGTRPQKRTLLSLEQLEDRVVPVVGAASIPVAIGHGFDSMTNQASHYDASANGVVYLYSWQLHQDGRWHSYVGTGAMLFGGKHILTAAHVVSDQNGHVNPKDYIQVVIETADGAVSFDVTAANIHLKPGWDGNVEHGNDLAILTISDTNKIPYGNSLYDIYANSDEVGRVFNIVGYGSTGAGTTGGEQPSTTGYKRMGQNRFDTDSDQVHHLGDVLSYDFDSGSSADDTLGTKAGVVDLGLGDREAFQGHGDSGGPVFVDGVIAGVVSYSYGYGGAGSSNRFGAVGVVTRVSAADNANWINSYIAPLIGRTGGRSYTLDLTGKADGQQDTVQVRTTATTVDFFVNGKEVHSEWLWGLDSITIKGSGDSTQFLIPTNLKDRVHLIGGSGSNGLVMDDQDYFSAHGRPEYLLTSSGVWRDGVQMLPANYSGVQSFTLRAGNAGSDVILQGLPNGMALDFEGGAGDDTIRLGDDVNSLSSLGSMLTVRGNGGHDSLILNDTAASDGYLYGGTPVYTISAGSIVRSQQVRYSFARPETTLRTQIDFHDFENVTLNGDHHGSIYNVESGYEATALTINGGRGDDTVSVGGVNDVSSIGRTFAFNGGAGNDSLILDDRTIADFPFPGGIVRPNVTFDITYHDVHYTDRAEIVSADTGEYLDTFGTFETTISYGRDVENLHIMAGSRPDIFNVDSTSEATALTIDGGDGDDIVTIGNPQSSIGAAAGALAFNGGNGNDSLVLDDRVIADFAFGDVTVRPNVEFTIGNGNVHYRDRADIVDPQSGAVQSNFGTFTASIAYGSDVENLHIMAGSRPDVFRIDSGSASAAVTIDGGDGRDTLSYASYQSGVVVDLAEGMATDLARALNFENVIGSAGNDQLRGDAGDNMLLGEAGDDILDGRAGRNILFGGLGADTLKGGGDDDLLIAGGASLDLDDAALQAIAAEWTRRDTDFQDRVNHLLGLADGGLNGAATLAAETISDDGSVDDLRGAGGQNWLIAGHEDIAVIDGRIAELESQRQAQRDRLNEMNSDSEAHLASVQADLEQSIAALTAAQQEGVTAAAQRDDLEQNQIPAAEQALAAAVSNLADAQTRLDSAQAGYDSVTRQARATPAAMQRQKLSVAQLTKQLRQANAASKQADASLRTADARYNRSSQALTANKNPKKTAALRQARDSAKKARDQAAIVARQKKAQLNLAQLAYDMKLARPNLNRATAAFKSAEQAHVQAEQSLSSVLAARDLAEANRLTAAERVVALQARIDQDRTELADPQAAIAAAQAELDATTMELTQLQQDRHSALVL